MIGEKISQNETIPSPYSYVCKHRNESHIRKVQLQQDYFIPLGGIVGPKELLSSGSVELSVQVIWKPWNKKCLNIPTLKKHFYLNVFNSVSIRLARKYILPAV